MRQRGKKIAHRRFFFIFISATCSVIMFRGVRRLPPHALAQSSPFRTCARSPIKLSRRHIAYLHRPAAGRPEQCPQKKQWQRQQQQQRWQCHQQQRHYVRGAAREKAEKAWALFRQHPFSMTLASILCVSSPWASSRFLNLFSLPKDKGKKKCLTICRFLFFFFLRLAWG